MIADYNDPANIEFGVCRGDFSELDAAVIPVDDDVKMLLYKMVAETAAAMGFESGDAIPRFEPSETYDGESRVVLPLDDPLASRLQAFSRLANIQTDPNALDEPQHVSAYFCIIHGKGGNRLFAVKRASQFKAILKAHLLRFIDNGLSAVTDNVFKLDADFDLFVMDGVVYMKSVAGFQQLADIDEAVAEAAVRNTRELARMHTGIGFLKLTDYIQCHKRAARIVAALRSRKDLHETSLTNLRRECRKAGVIVQMGDGKLVPAPGHEMGFLNMLDRRRYAISLVAGRWEEYEAGSRKGVGVREKQEEVATPVMARAARRRG